MKFMNGLKMMLELKMRVSKFKKLEVDGSTLLTLTKEDLKNEFQLLPGPAYQIINKLNKIKNSLGM